MMKVMDLIKLNKSIECYFSWTLKNSYKHLFYAITSCPYIKKLKGNLLLERLMEIEVTIGTELIFPK